MTLPVVSLNAVTASGPGAVLDYEDTVTYSMLMVEVTGSWSGNVVVQLELSHDGQTWLTNPYVPGGSLSIPVGSAGAVQIVPTVVGGNLGIPIPHRYARANCTTYQSGATVTATVAGVLSGGQNS